MLRINDFVAILVQENRDYDNNQVPSNSVTSTLAIGTSFYVGGVPNGININSLAVSIGLHWVNPRFTKPFSVTRFTKGVTTPCELEN